jgi:hypothetical protein
MFSNPGGEDEEMGDFYLSEIADKMRCKMQKEN